MELHLRDGLQEINYGAWEGKDVDTVNAEYHGDYLRWLADPGWNPPTGCESAMAIAARALAVVEEVSQKHTTGNVLMVSPNLAKSATNVLLGFLLLRGIEDRGGIGIFHQVSKTATASSSFSIKKCCLV
jgi:broad specificity phosphatase PhoE